MTVDPDQIYNLITTFCALDEEFRVKAIEAMNKVFVDYLSTKACTEKGIPVTKENQIAALDKVADFIDKFSSMIDNQKAALTIFMEQLEPGLFTKDNELEIKINQRVFTLEEYITRILPNADFSKAKQFVNRTK